MKQEDAAVLVAKSLKQKEIGEEEQIVHVTKIKSITRLWAGMGEIFEIVFYVNNNKNNQMSIICKEISIPSGADNSLSCGDLRKKRSYFVEQNFYDSFAEILNEHSIVVPKGLYTNRTASTLFICMSKLNGEALNGLGIKEASSAVKWAAKLHALTWQEKADKFVEKIGLQSQGTYWYLDTRLDEIENMSRTGWEGRLFLAAAAIDARLKTDPFQAIVHGDFKANNMVSDDDHFALCDFQYSGKACCLKDICYMIACYCKSNIGNNNDNDNNEYHDFEKELLELYYNELQLNLKSDNANAKIPPYEELLVAVDLCFVDLVRWMAGWGFWGNDFLIPRAKLILDKLDSGKMLSDENEYKKAVALVYPTKLF